MFWAFLLFVLLYVLVILFFKDQEIVYLELYFVLIFPLVILTFSSSLDDIFHEDVILPLFVNDIITAVFTLCVLNTHLLESDSSLKFNLFITLALEISSFQLIFCESLLQFFILIEVIFVISLFYLYGENILHELIFLYFIPNVVVSLFFLYSINVFLLDYNTDDLWFFEISKILNLENQTSSYYLLEIAIIFLLCSKFYIFPVSLIISPLYNQMKPQSVTFFSLVYLILGVKQAFCLQVFLSNNFINVLNVLCLLTIIIAALNAVIKNNLKSILANISIINLNTVLIIMLNIQEFIETSFCFYFIILYVLSNFPFFFFFNLLNVHNFSTLVQIIKGSSRLLFVLFILSTFVLSGFPISLFFFIKILNFFITFKSFMFIAWTIYTLFSFMFFIKLIYLSIFVQHSTKINSIEYLNFLKFKDTHTYLYLFCLFCVMCTLFVVIGGFFFFSFYYVFLIF